MDLVEEEYIRKYELISKLMDSHTFLTDSLWFQIVRKSDALDLDYEQMKKEIKNQNIAFTYSWKKGKFIRKRNDFLCLYHDFKFTGLVVGAIKEFVNLPWVLCT